MIWNKLVDWKMKVFYIHGIGGENSSKAKEIGKDFKVVIPLQENHSPLLSLIKIQKLILEEKDNVILVGSSRGGLLALFLSLIYELPLVLMNPAIEKSNLNKGIFGYKADFELDLISRYVKKNINKLKSNYCVFLSIYDEVVNYKIADNILNNNKYYIDDNHKIIQFNKIYPEIKNFILRNS